VAAPAASSPPTGFAACSRKSTRVVLADRTPQYSFAPSYPWLMLGRRTGRRISRDLRALEKKGIEVRIGEVKAIDTANKQVTVGDEKVAYDYLVIALGAQYSSEEIEGLNKTWTFYHLEGAEGLQERLPKFEGGLPRSSSPPCPTSARPRPTRAPCSSTSISASAGCATA
jgi:NADH dehydrogenase FAD-containing subunit